ncbi:MAG: type II secretion system major pseudopilin GspG [Candidatus Hydrogenedentes bacterium]|nr:type II secretion system major pseudopilin GspG [Candidatus Hydrogenedentota bacterium]
MHKQPRLVSSYLRTRRYRKNAGFTLVELLLVMVILVALAAVVLPKFSGRSEQARETAAIAQINAFETVLDSFEVDNGYYPEGPDGLIDLVEQPPDADNWHGPYLKEIPLDPWGQEYIYDYPGKNNVNGYDLMSMGPDRQQGTDDDITNWSKDRR